MTMSIDAYRIKGGLVMRAMEPVLNVYDDAIAQGMSASQAQAKAQLVYSEKLKYLKQSDAFSDAEKAVMQSTFDPVRMHAGAESYQWRFPAQKKERSNAPKHE